MLKKAFERACARSAEVPFDSLSEPEKVLVSLWAIEAEVNNGGFHQFFFNSSGGCAFFAPTALRILGAPQMAHLAERANSVFGPAGPPRDWDARQEALLALGEAEQALLEELDLAFQAYPEDLALLGEAYAAEHYPRP